MEWILWNEQHAQNLMARDKLHSHVDLLLHPRRPPFVRTLPFVESLSLSSVEESAEEMTTRHSLDLAFGNGEIHSITYEGQNWSNPVGQNSLTPDPDTTIDPLPERHSPISIELQTHTTSDTDGNLPMKAITPSVLSAVPSSQAIPAIPAESTLISAEGPASTIYVAPILVDESDHEEVPSIDLGSDSDA